MSARARSCIVLLAALAASCSTDRLLNTPPPARARPDILDASHGGGNPHFFFLPKIVHELVGATGTFDPGQSPVVVICAWSGGACASTVASYTMTSGPGGETVKLNLPEQAYGVTWRTGQFSLSPTAIYRIQVFVGAQELGHVDATVSAPPQVQQSAGFHVDLRYGATFVIRFRIEQGAVASAPPPAITAASIITTIAGTGAAGYNGDGIPATSAVVWGPGSVAFGPDGSLYISESGGMRVRRVYPNGIITTVAGTGVAGFSGDGGPATAAQFAWPHANAIGPDGTIYIADYGTCHLRKVDPNGIVTTIAGDGTGATTGDGGPASAAAVCPVSLARASDGTLYLGTYSANNVRRIDPNGIITTVAGTGAAGYSGDGGPALSAMLNGPGAVGLGPDGALYIGENSGHRIRRVDLQTGVITTFAGTGSPGNSGDGGPATSAQITQPAGLIFGPDNALYFNSAHTIRRIGTDGVISTVVGTGVPGFGGDGGPAGQAQLWYPADLAFAPDGALIIPDSYNNRVRRVK